MSTAAVYDELRELKKENKQLKIRVTELEKAFNQYGGPPPNDIASRLALVAIERDALFRAAQAWCSCVPCGGCESCIEAMYDAVARAVGGEKERMARFACAAKAKKPKPWSWRAGQVKP